MENMQKIEIFYIRHADTSGGLCADRDECDIDLSVLGEKQCELLAMSFAGIHFDAVFSSPLVRTVRTAASVCNMLDGHPVIELMPELIECNSTHAYTGTGIEYLQQYYDSFVWCKDTVFGNPHGDFPNDSDVFFDARGRAVAAYLKHRFAYGQRILLFGHGSFANHFLPAAVGIRDGDFIFSINHTSITKIKYTPDGKQRISYMNDVQHLSPVFPGYRYEI